MSEIKVNKISPRSSTTVTLGDSGDTFTIPSGATINNQGTAVNFGATGSASWNTTVKTGDFTAVAGEGYFVDTSSGAISVTLPASPTAGAVVAVKDYADSFDTHNCTLLRNGSNIGGLALNSILLEEGIAVTLVYVDVTKGWLVTDSGLQSEAPVPQYISASGGTPTTSPCGDYKIHTFTGPGTFTVSAVGNAAGSNTVDYVVVAGGGGGGLGNSSGAGGGGAGGVRFYTETAIPGAPASPRNNFPLGTVATISATSFPIDVGGGAPARPNSTPSTDRGNDGSNTTFSNIVAAGGGGGGSESPGGGYVGANGGSAGGGGYHGCVGGGGTGNTPTTTPAQGSDGGGFGGPAAPTRMGGGGGGFMQAGFPGTIPQGTDRGNGGAGGGVPSAIVGTAGEVSSGNQYFGGGGAGQSQFQPAAEVGVGGLGGGGNGGENGGPGTQTATSGTVNTGGGGGAGYVGSCIGAGGSGIVIIRYKFQN